MLQQIRVRDKHRERFLDQLYNVGLYQDKVVQLKCDKNAGQNKSVVPRDRVAWFPGHNARLLKRITVSQSQKENVKTLKGKNVKIFQDNDAKV